MSDRSSVVGVLALQGDYQKHLEILDAAGIAGQAVRFADDFGRVDRLIIPGGESTVIADLLVRLGMHDEFAAFIRSRPVWGTCAGMILLAAKVSDGSVATYDAIDITVERNGYGRQVHSLVAPSSIALNGSTAKLDLVFIRAPRVTAVGPGVTTLLSWNDDPVLLAQKNVLVSAFHPELTGSTLLHEYFARRFPVDAMAPKANGTL
jgi:pyridoxal 5'-phosphate synthase pdxT subunit